MKLKGIAVPGDDGLDTTVILNALAKNDIYKVSSPHANEDTIFDGMVALRQNYWPDSFSEKFQEAPKNHPNIQKAIRLLECWPAIYRQFSSIICEFQPVHFIDNTEDGFFGSMSHQPPDTFGSMWATVNDYVCLSQAFVHEMAHNKLFAIGQKFESSLPIFKNASEELYDSPIRTDVPRPISAVFHGLYAFTHVVSLNRRMLESGVLSREEKNHVLSLVRKNADRVRAGLQVIVKCAIPTETGRDFVTDTINWANSELDMCRQYCAIRIENTGPIVVFGPLGAGKSTFAEKVARILDRRYISLDTFCYQHWYANRNFQKYMCCVFGESKTFLLNNIVSAEDKKNIIMEFFQKKILCHNDFDQMKLELLQYAINRYPESIIDTGSGHVVFSSPEYSNKLKSEFTKRNTIAIQVRPIDHMEGTLDLLRERLEGRGQLDTIDADKIIRASITNPSYRILADYVFDSGDASSGETPDQYLKSLFG